MENLKELQKAKGLECLKKLKICDDFIEVFEKKDEVCYFVGYAGHWAWQDKEITEKIKELEEKYEIKVYAVIVTFSQLGKLYDFLYISKCSEDWEDMIMAGSKVNQFIIPSYCWNKDYKYLSEFGSIIVNAQFGGMRRVG